LALKDVENREDHAYHLELLSPPRRLEKSLPSPANCSERSEKGVPAISWKSFGRAEPERQYLVLLSFLPLKHGWRVPWFLLHTVRIMNQLKRSRGLGYSLLAQPLAKRFWTLSAWEDESALGGFVQAQPHVRTMDVMARHMDKTKFVRWTGKFRRFRRTGTMPFGAWAGD
jgi:hypothetical protein